jgi:hypothetical protein
MGKFKLNGKCGFDFGLHADRNKQKIEINNLADG